LNFAIMTGGNTPINSPGANQAYQAEILAEARRRLAAREGQQAVLDARKQQWMTGERSAADGFMNDAEKQWVEQNAKLIGSQRQLPGGSQMVTSDNGYQTIVDKQGRVIGTNKPLAAPTPYAGETGTEARAAINRGEGTVADRQRLSDLLQQSIYQDGPKRTPEAPAPAPAPAPTTFREQMDQFYGPDVPQVSLADIPYSNPFDTAESPSPAATQTPAPTPTKVPLSPQEKERLSQMEAEYGVQGLPSKELKLLGEQRGNLVRELQRLQQARDLGKGNLMSYTWSDEPQGQNDFQSRTPLTPEEAAKTAARVNELNRLLAENVKQWKAMGTAQQTPAEAIDEWTKLNARR
jgi:hypothetical protein